MSINDESVKKYKTILQNLSDYKKTSIFIKDLILQLKNSISNNELKIKEHNKSDNKIYYTIKYNPTSNYLINQLKEILDESENLETYQTFFSMIYPDGNQIDFDTEIEIEISNLNRIHIPIGLPYIIKGIGIGKKVYKKLIYKLGYLSSTYYDRSMESLYVWDSIRKDDEIFTFICDQKILSISPNTNFNNIENILSIFYQNITTEHIIFDDDFKNQYNKEILKSYKINSIFKYEINQDI